MPFLALKKKINIKHFIGEIIVCVVVLAILLTVLIPTISKSVANGSENKCRNVAYKYRSALEKSLSNSSSASKIKELLNQKSSSKIFDELKASIKNGEKLNSKNYYIKSEDNKLYIYCAEHPEIDDIYVKLPEGFTVSKAAKEKDGFTNYIQVTGFRTYMQNESINPDKPEQMKFTSSDNLKKIFSDISVKLVMAGGLSRKLSPDQYTVSTDGFDMSVPGTKKLKIAYKTDKTWNRTMYAEFSFEVMKKTDSKPLIIGFGDKGSYELAAWDWSDYVTEATQTLGSSKNFDASIVHFKGKYYYYPDGFNINKRRDNSDPSISASDIDDNTIPAYRIEFKTNHIISAKENKDEMKKVKDGALMLEEEQVYIWQSAPSKELSSGWIRVFCEMKKK